jgi:dihydroorotate dehydrogenase electron transfer subunit
MPKQISDAVIQTINILNEKYFTVEIKPYIWESVSAGQFLQLTVPNASDVFLRRPISIHDIDTTQRTISLLIQIVGKGTEALSKLKTGDKLNIIYPLGKGFSMLPAGKKTLLIGGGCGIAPLLYLAKVLNHQHVKTDILIGIKNKNDLIEFEKYKALGDVFVTTEDGSIGTKGFVTHHSVMNELKKYDMIYTCGPEVMMKAVNRKAITAGVECEVSLENTMACGVGACLCCVTPTVNGHQCVCTEGPVFNTKKLLW